MAHFMYTCGLHVHMAVTCVCRVQQTSTRQSKWHYIIVAASTKTLVLVIGPSKYLMHKNKSMQNRSKMQQCLSLYRAPMNKHCFQLASCGVILSSSQDTKVHTL